MRIAAIVYLIALVDAAALAQVPPHGRVVGDAEFADAQSARQQADIEHRIERNVAELARQGLLVRPGAKAAAIADLQWPLQPIAGFDQFDYHGTKYFVDHDPRAPGFVQDYTCGTRTYDLATGYNHAGTDYYLWPFPWLMMDQGVVQIVAAAPGVIVDKADGNYDRDCSLDGDGEPNAVYVAQDDGLVAHYLHMRNGSVTTSAIGARVAAGEYLGLVGSSGASTGPHLHFELQDTSGNIVDPRHGQCNAAPDRWAVFQAYEDPHIDTLSTHSAEPTNIDCGEVNGALVEEQTFYKNAFIPGDTLWVFVSYRDQRDGEVTHFEILRPDGSAFAQWDFDLATQGLPRPFYSGTSWDWSYALPGDAPNGTWIFRAEFQGQTYSRDFSVGDGIFANDFSIEAERVALARRDAAALCGSTDSPGNCGSRQGH